jgi:NADH:ubiquinone oxidoreductase subunit D
MTDFLFVDKNKIPSNAHRFLVMTTTPDSLPLVGVRGDYPRYFLIHAFEPRESALFHVYVVRDAKSGTVRLGKIERPDLAHLSKEDQLTEVSNHSDIAAIFGEVDRIISHDLRRHL